MNETIDDIVIDDFERLTSYDVGTFFENYLEFIEIHYSNITNFYSGISNVVPTVANNKLANLIKEHKKIIDVTILNAESISDHGYWQLLEYIEDIGHVLETANNVSKWLRSSTTKNGYKQQVIVEYMLGQGESLELAERRSLKSNDPSETWIETALQNELREDDYDLDGGYLIKATYKNNASLFLTGIVDNIDTPEKTYGLDIKKTLEWSNSDLVTLNYQDTIQQCAEILANLQKEQDPAFPERGISTKSIIGQSSAGISYPIIFRDLATNFATDDSFKSFQIIDIRRQNDAIYLDFSVETKGGDIISNSIAI